MIAKMKKLLLFVADSNATVDEELADLGRLGLVHIVPFQPARDKSIELLNGEIQDAEKALEILAQYPETDQLPAGADSSAADYVRLVLEAEEQRILLLKEQASLQNDLNWYARWGNVTPSSFRELEARGVFLRLYELSDKDLKALKDRSDLLLVGQAGGMNQVVLLAQDASEKLPFMEVRVLQTEKAEIEASLADLQNQLEATANQLAELAAHKESLTQAKEDALHRLEILHVQYGGVSVDGQFHYWKGFIPESRIDQLVEAADQNGWGYLIEDATEEDAEEVPTLIHTSRFGERIKPVMNFMGLVPGYNELDVSHVFMIFFTFFTGILVGDAGYGLIFFLLTLFVHAKTKFVRKVEFQLMYTLSVSILFWGVLTGTYFGSETVANIPFLANLKVDKLASFGGDNVFVQRFMFFVGAVHLTVGHLQLAVRYINSLKALAQLGWIAITWGLFFVVNQMVLQIAAPAFMVWLFVGGAILVALFSSTGTSFAKGVLASIGNLPLSIINGFSDIISYVRLYAVGLSTVLMAASFNNMAVGDGVTTVLAGLGAVIVLILGHGLNMALAAMAVLVHGVRLNMLEYAGHANVEFSGNEYNPFKLKK